MLNNRVFNISCNEPDTVATVTPLCSSGGIDLYKINVRFPRKMRPSPVTVSWTEKMRNILHVWHPLSGFNHTMHQWFGPTQVRSCFHFGAPIMSTVGDLGKNVQTVATSDPITPTLLQFWVDDVNQENNVAYCATFFDGICDDILDYEVLLRIDTRDLPFYETVRQVYPWWKSCGWDIPKNPAGAEDAVYSTWYNFHQMLDSECLLADLKIASELGFKTIILDDGWHFPGSSSCDFSRCGEWKVSTEKFPDFKAFSDEVHALGMKLAIWIGIPFIGIHSPLFEKFSGKYLYVDYGIMNEGTLDPRYPEVREFIVSTCRRMLDEYNIDGFKFDFIDAILPRPETPAYDPAVMDFETTGEAVRCLLAEIRDKLAEVKSDLLYEYRQCYIGPAINLYGNMLRVADCAYDSHINRIGSVDLRLLNYPIAIHSDPLFWAPNESLRLCARQLLNSMFSVPQIAVVLAESTEEQKALLHAYLTYWTNNRELLLHGRFCPKNIDQNYSLITAEDDNRVIAVLHADLPYTYDGRICDVFHNGDRDGLVFENPTDAEICAEIYTEFGSNLVSRVAVAPHSIVRLPVPITGLLRIR